MRNLRLSLIVVMLSPLFSNEPSLRWCWSGGLTDTQAVVVAAFAGAERATIELSQTATGNIVHRSEVTLDPHGIGRFTVSNLSDLTGYRYQFSVGTTVLGGGAFHSMPQPGTPASFTIGLGSCSNDANNPVFRAIAHQNPLLFLHTGDLHYSDIGSNNPDDFRRAFERVLSDPAQSALYRSRGIAYVWDDHDFGPNDSRHNNPSREAAHATYRQVVPHYPLALTDESPERAAPIAQAFTIGRVRFIITDLRSEHSRQRGSLMGASQREWFLAEVQAASAQHALVVWVSSVPWIAKSGGDNWASGRAERTEIANALAALGMPICIVSGDAHMLAIDDGSNSNYATVGSMPIPVFQAAALGRSGSYKGGPYSHGAHPGTQQFGLMRIEDNGTSVSVHWSGRDGSDGVGERVVNASRDGTSPLEYHFMVNR